MIIIGEQINATRKVIAAALEAREESVIVNAAKAQASAGADYIDVNGGDAREGREVSNVEWLIDLVQANTDVPISVDSANPEAVELGLSKSRGKCILNSVSLETHRLENLLPVVERFDCLVVALLMSDSGTPSGVEDRLECAEKLVGHLTSAGKKVEDIIIDPCFLPVSADACSARAVIDSIAAIRQRWPEIHIGGGCSNTSYGLPKRKFINFAVLTQAIYHGMDVGIIDPCVPDMMSVILAAQAVAGRDEFCMNYVTRMR